MDIDTLNSARKKPRPFLMSASAEQLRAVHGAVIKPRKTKLRTQYVREREWPSSPEAKKSTQPGPQPDFLWTSGLGVFDHN
ncbi:hypothetical protein [Thiomonas sp.]